MDDFPRPPQGPEELAACKRQEFWCGEMRDGWECTRDVSADDLSHPGDHIAGCYADDNGPAEVMAVWPQESRT